MKFTNYKLTQTYSYTSRGHHGAAPRGNSQSSHVCGERKGEWVLVPAPARTTTLDSIPWTDVYLSTFAVLLEKGVEFSFLHIYNFRHHETKLMEEYLYNLHPNVAKFSKPPHEPHLSISTCLAIDISGTCD